MISAAPLATAWQAAWPQALAAWSPFIRLRDPLICTTSALAREQGLSGSFAMIRLTDQTVVIDLEHIITTGLADFAVEVLAHEIGHHVLAPATLLDHARMISRMRWALPTLEREAPMLANLYTDLLINDRLCRQANLRMADIYRKLARNEDAASNVWRLYMRIYENLWNLPRGDLHSSERDDRIEGDAWIGARLIRSYAAQWLDGSGRFAALLLPYVLEDRGQYGKIARLLDTRSAGAGGDILGAVDPEPGEREGAIHPALDSQLNGEAEQQAASEVTELPREGAAPQHAGQARQPFEYGELLRSLGIDISDHDIAVRYYREKALPHLVRFPARKSPQGYEPQPEGLEPWDIGQPLDDIDWLQSVSVSPVVIPGMTTVQRTFGTMEGVRQSEQPLDLDIYVDSSGSMMNPQTHLSFPALAGAIICISALRAGARVQATLWSGKNQFETTRGFVRDENAILRVLTGYFGGATAFPIHILRDTFAQRTASDRHAHILIVSDDGVSTLFDADERANSGWDMSRMALANARGGGTMVLQLPESWESLAKGDASHYGREAYAAIARARDEQDWAVYRIAAWDDLVVFAREFSRRRYGQLSK